MSAALIALVLAAASPAKGAVVDELEDGTDLVVVPVAGKRVSVRLVIRSGGDDDPPGRAGLAHLLEHLIFHGTYEEPEGVFFERAWGAGANLNAYTSSDWTTYVLDVDADRFDALAPSFFTMVTSPALPFASFERERGVVAAEQSDRPNMMSITFAFDQQAYPSANGGQTAIGTEKSREAITIEDVQDFYALHYVPENAVLVVAGAVTAEQVRTAARQGLRWPPKLKGPARNGVEEPNVPSEAKGLSAMTVTVHGRLIDGQKPGACEAAAGLLDLRLRRRIIAEESMVADVAAGCHRQRGHDFLVMYVATSSPESSLVPDWLKDLAKSAARVPPTATERALVEGRRRALLSRMQARADIVADGVMFALIDDDLTARGAVDAVLAPPPLRWGDVGKLLGAAARDEALVELHFSRFER